MQVSSVQSLEQMGRRGDIRDDSAEILFQSFLRETFVSSSGIGRSVHSLMLSIQHFLCRPRRRSPSKVPRRMFCGGCHGVWHARTMQIFLSSQLPEEVLVDPQGSWSCSAPVVGLPLQVGDTEKFPRLKRQNFKLHFISFWMCSAGLKSVLFSFGWHGHMAPLG